MRVSSASASLYPQEPPSRHGQESGASAFHVWPLIKRYFHKLDRLFTAISYAEAGDLDAVQKILDENEAMKKQERHPHERGGMERR